MKLQICVFVVALIHLSTISVMSQIQNPRNVEYVFKTDTSNRVIDLNELQLVLPRESFPIIDYPAFVGMQEGIEMFYEKEPVIAVEIDGRAKAYPLAMLTMHEMTNDTLSGIPILPTFCPLCNASVVYDRRFKHDGEEYVLEFEVSGMLRKSDMVMFDRQTETWWQQLMGYGIVGEFAGEYLDVISSLVISVEEFFHRYPEGEILSTKTGTRAEERYGNNPYVSYDSIGNDPYGRFFDPVDVDDRLPAMERVVDIEVGGDYKIYPWSAITSTGVIHDSFNGEDIVVWHESGMVSVMDAAEIKDSRDIGTATVFSPFVNDQKLTFQKKGSSFVDTETGSEWEITGRCIDGELKGSQLVIVPHGNHFAFAWLAFHPNTEIYVNR